MRPRIPRDMLWRNRETIEELLDEPLFKVLHEAFFYFEKEPMLFPMDEVAILNEVGYQVTWLCYESRLGFEPDMEQLTREVFAHTGLKDHAMTVISLVQAAVKLVNFPPLNISKRTKHELSKLNKESWCKRYVDQLVKRVIDDGEVFSEQFLPYADTIEIQYIEDDMNDFAMCAEPFEEEQDNIRRFTLDEIVEYAQQNLTIEIAYHIQLMLHTLMQNDSTKEEREKVSSIPTFILKRHTGDQVQGNKTSFGNYSNMLNFNLPEHADYEKFFAALPDSVKQMMIKKLMSNDNG